MMQEVSHAVATHLLNKLNNLFKFVMAGTDAAWLQLDAVTRLQWAKPSYTVAPVTLELLFLCKQ